MKFTITLIGLLFFLASSAAIAQTVPYDSLAVDTIITGSGVSNPDNVKGNPDTRQATLTSSSLLSVQFAAGHDIVTLQKGATIHVYWLREASDSSAADIQFLHYDYNTGIPRLGPTVRIMELGDLNAEKETDMIVPDTGYNALQVTIAADTGAGICWIDAITLMQSGTAGVEEQLASREAVLASYPNPFEHSSPETVHIDAPVSGRGELLISDALGREVERMPVGELHAGGQDVSLSMNQTGIFFARLMIDGAPVGPPLKLVAE